MLAAPDLDAFAEFLSVPVGTLGAADTQALKQSAFLLQLLSGCSDYPTADPCKTLFDNAIMDMANWMKNTLPFVAVVSSPFQSETIGSYSYSKNFRNILLTGLRGGDPTTGVLWFDLAVSECGCGSAEDSLMGSGGITVFEHEDVFTATDGRRWVLGPAETIGFGPEAGFELVSDL